MLLKEIKEILTKWTASHGPQLIRLRIKMAIFQNLKYRFSVILIKIPGSIFVEIDILKFTYKYKELE